MDIDEVDRMFKFIYKRMMHTVPEIFKVPTIMKSADSSNKVSQYAKEYFIKKDYFNALWLYDRAIACADSEELLAKGYAKRSKIYFELGRYEDCLNSIQLALENEYPAEKIPKLKVREEKCKEMMSQAMDVEDKEDLWDFFKLSYPANEKIPWLVDRVEMRWTAKYGRGIYAKEDLKAGDIICIEEPAINYAHEDNTYMRCFNCFKTNALNLIPCDVTGSLMFCSATCKDNFNEKASDITEMRCADLKMLSEIFEAFGSVNRFDDFMERIDPKKDLNKTIFDYDWTNPEDTQYKRNKILCLLSLTTNERPILRNYIVGKHVSEKTARHLMSIFMLNFQEVYYNNGDSKSSNVGWCIPLFSSLINHSCVRNAVPILVDNKIVTIMQKPVKAGEQIFFCYPPNSIMFNSVLLKTVQINHEFHCDCEICANDLKLDLADQNALLEPFKNEPNPAYDRDYDKTREYLKEAWNILNNDPPTVKGYSPHMLRTVEVLETIAFQIAYPFNPPEPELF